MRKRVPLALFGLGRIGKLHAASLVQRISSAELVRVVDKVPEVARTTGAALGVEWSTSYRDSLDDPTIEGIVIATPTPLHAEMIEHAAHAKKHVFCEKPIAFALEPTVQAVKVARSAGIHLQIGFHRRFDPDWAEAYRRIVEGGVGDPQVVRITHRDRALPNISHVDDLGDLYIDLAIHDFDTARWLVGEIEEITSVAAARDGVSATEPERAIHALTLLRFANGALGIVDNSREAGYGFECSTEVMGSRGMLRLGGGHRRTDVEWLHSGDVHAPLPTCHADRHALAYVLELEHFVQSLRHDRPPEVTGEDAAAAFVLAQAARRALQTGRSVRLRHEKGLTGVAYELVGAERGNPDERAPLPEPNRMHGAA